MKKNMQNSTLKILLFVLAILAPTIFAYGAGVKYEDIKFSQPFKSEKWNFDKHCKIESPAGGQETLTVEIPKGEPRDAYARISVDVKKYAGKKLFFTADISGENISKVEKPYYGVKFQASFVSGGKKYWEEPNFEAGDFKTKPFRFSFDVPADLEKISLSLGLQNGTGRATFKNLRFCTFDTEPSFALPENFKAEYSDDVLNTPILRGAMSPTNFDLQDLKTLASWKANVVRLQVNRHWNGIDVNKDIAEFMAWVDTKIDEIKRVAPELDKLGMQSVVDMHTPVGGRYADKEMIMFHDEKYARAFVDMWRHIASKLKDVDGIWAYDLINEPVQKVPAQAADYLELQYRAAKAIREIDPNRPIIVESAEWDSPAAFKYLKPLPLKNIIYQAHMYIPGSYTHQLVFDNLPNRHSYPSEIEGVYYDKAELEKALKPVLDFQKKYGARIYIGEFSAIRWAQNSEKYLEDCIEIFEANSWDWSYHAFREWQGWSVEHTSDKDDLQPAKEPPARKKLLLKYFERNSKVVEAEKVL